MTSQEYVDQATAAGVPQSAIDSFLANNPGDYSRILSALGPDYPQSRMNVDTGLIEYADPMTTALAQMGFGLGSGVAGMGDMIFEGEIGGVGALVPAPVSSPAPPVVEGSIVRASTAGPGPGLNPWLLVALVVVAFLLLGDN